MTINERSVSPVRAWSHPTNPAGISCLFYKTAFAKLSHSVCVCVYIILIVLVSQIKAQDSTFKCNNLLAFIFCELKRDKNNLAVVIHLYVLMSNEQTPQEAPPPNGCLGNIVASLNLNETSYSEGYG